MVLALICYILGYLELRVSGGSPERFLHLAVSRGIYCWNVRQRDGDLHLNVGVRAFRALRPVARRPCRSARAESSGRASGMIHTWKCPSPSKGPSAPAPLTCDGSSGWPGAGSS